MKTYMATGLVAVLLTMCWTVVSANGLSPVEQLGKDLFFDENLSTPAGVSCASCHAPETAFVGPLSDINAHEAVYEGAAGGRFGNRKPPTAAYASFSPDFYYDEDEGLFIGGMFWDGRAANTIEQAKGPFLNPMEMNNPNQRSVIIKILGSDYAKDFAMLYAEWFAAQYATEMAMPELSLDKGDPEFIANAYQFMAEAIAAYEASSEVNQFSSKYDAYLAGNATLTAEETFGLTIYEGKAHCNACHPSELGPNGEPPLFTDFTYDNLGVPKNPENPWYDMPPGFNPDGPDWVDYGLGAQVGLAEEMGKQKVPTLRNVGMRPYAGFVQAYGHNGYFKTLEDIVHFYNTRDVLDWPDPEVAENVNTDELGNLNLTAAEEAALVAFLKALTDGWVPPASAPLVTGSSVLLGRVQPNPFHAAARIHFRLPEAVPVNLDVVDVQGRLVRRLIDNQPYQVGPHDMVWNATDDTGRRVAPGVYFYRLKAGKDTKAQRMVVLP